MALVRGPKGQIKSVVAIPVPGEAPENVTLIFKRFRSSEIREMSKAGNDEDIARQSVVGWEGDEIVTAYGEFSADRLNELLEDCPGAAAVIGRMLIHEHFEGRQKN